MFYEACPPVPQWLSRKQPTRKMSFGFHRAEMLGALGSVLIIWALTAMLLYSAIDRVFNPTGSMAPTRGLCRRVGAHDDVSQR